MSIGLKLTILFCVAYIVDRIALHIYIRVCLDAQSSHCPKSRLPPWASHHGHEIVHVHEAIAVPVYLPHHPLAILQAAAVPELAQHCHDLLGADPAILVPVEHEERPPDIPQLHAIPVHLHELLQVHVSVLVVVGDADHPLRLSAGIGLPEPLQDYLEILLGDLAGLARDHVEYLLHLLVVRLVGAQVGELPVPGGQ
uniref:Uncharacterized protein n=1 Tax=Arundo donax TaxID=35708 RepID=A0A0A9D0D5_ARUDO